MSALTTLFQSTIGKKVLMGVTGLIMVGWLTLHMLGNLLVFMGQESFNHYAHFIQSGFGVEPGLLWFMRFVMLASIVGHIWAAIMLGKTNAMARPQGYAAPTKTRNTTYAAQFMRLGGLTLLAFLVFHLAHLTVGSFSDGPLMATTFSAHDAYANLVYGVGVPYVGAFYILANLALGAHLFHGVKSAFQTLGLNDVRWNDLKQQLTVAVPLVIAGGNILIALAAMFGVGVLIDVPDPSWTSPY